MEKGSARRCVVGLSSCYSVIFLSRALLVVGTKQEQPYRIACGRINKFSIFDNGVGRAAPRSGEDACSYQKMRSGRARWPYSATLSVGKPTDFPDVEPITAKRASP